jgi:hypothetical protein
MHAVVNNNYLNVVKFNIHALSCCFILYAFSVFNPVPSVLYLGEVPLKAPRRTKMKVTILQPLLWPSSDYSHASFVFNAMYEERKLF